MYGSKQDIRKTNEGKKYQNSQIIIYQTELGQTNIEVRLQDETVWLTQKLMAGFFQTTKQNISLHLQNIFAEWELDEHSVVKDYLTTASDGKTIPPSFII